MFDMILETLLFFTNSVFRIISNIDGAVMVNFEKRHSNSYFFSELARKIPEQG